jgi:WD40 repeat protein
VRVFRDDRSLSANPNLWSSIETALARTRYLVLLASPEAAASPWVRREVEWWLSHRSPDTLFLAVTAGRVPWSEDAGRERSVPSCIPEYILDRYPSPPRWVDLRPLRSEQQISRQNPALLDAIADIGAAVRGIDKDEIVGEHIRQHRRVVRTASAAIVVLSMLTVATVIASVLFAAQRNTARQQALIARKQALIATAKQFAATAGNVADGQIDLAMLLAAKAYRMNPEPDTLSAAFKAATASPKLTYVAHAGQAISALAPRPAGKAVLTGWSDGTIADFDPRTTRWTRLGKLPHAVVDLASAQDGRTTVATDGYEVDVIDGNRVSRKLARSRQKNIDAVALESDGSTLAYGSYSWPPGGNAISTLTVASTLDGSRTSVTIPNASFSRISLAGGYLFGFNGGSGNWVRLTLPDLRLSGSLQLGFGTHDYAAAMSADGSAVTYTNSAAQIPIWDTAVTKNAPNASYWPANPTRWGRGPGVNPQAMSLSADGKRLAVADSGTIYVTDPAKDPIRTTSVAQLTGLTGHHIDHMVFLGDDVHLAVASGSTVALYNLTQASPLTLRQPAQVPVACTACRGAVTFPSPDGAHVAFMADAGGGIVIHDLRTGRETTYGDPDTSYPEKYAPPAWSPDGRYLMIPRPGDGTVDVLTTDKLTRTRRWPGADPGQRIVSSRFIDGGHQFITVTNDGRVIFRDATTGSVRRTTRPVQPIGDSYRWDSRLASVNSTGTRLTFINLKGVFTVDLTRGVISKLRGTTSQATVLPTSIAYAGHRLLVAYRGGGGNWIDVYRDDGTTLLRHFPLPAGALEDPVGSDTGQLIAYQAYSGAVVLLDATTSKQIGSFQLTASVEGYKTGLAFTASGNHLFTVTNGEGRPGEVQRWSVDPNAITHKLCYLAGRTLAIKEWQALAGSRRPDLRCP